MRPLHVVVIGGGPSGLACAHRLAGAGLSVTVLEACDRPGGLCATYEKDGFRFDLGGHRFISGNAELARKVRAWMGTELLVQDRRSAVLHDGRYFHYPLDAGDLVRSLGLREIMRATFDYAVSRARSRVAVDDSHGRHFESWVRQRFGDYLYDTFFGPYTEKLWGCSAREISADWAEERIGLLNLGDAALRLVGLRTTPIRTYARRYEYPRLGMGQLFDRIADESTRLGARIELGARVTGFELKGSRIVAVHAERDQGGRTTFPADAVYATSALPEVATQLGAQRELPPPIAASASRLRFRGLRFLNLCLRGEHVQPYTWVYVADGARKISRIQEPSKRSPHMTPNGMGSLMLEIPANPGDKLWTMTDAELLAFGLGELDSLGYSVRSRVVSSFSVRVEAGYPVYHLQHEVDRARLLAHLSELSNLVVGGRQGLFRYVFLDRAMEMGDDAARAMLSGSMRADSAERPPVRASAPLEASALLG